MHEIELPNTCSIVILGSQFVEKIEEVMSLVDEISESLNQLPLFVMMINISKEFIRKIPRHDSLPPLVS